jgi:hypothetical protein
LTSFEDESWSHNTEWPNRGRFNKLPDVGALIKFHCPPPCAKPEPVNPELRQEWDAHCEKVKVLEKEKGVLIDKLHSIQTELEKAEKAPQNYSAARWGALSARDSLMKRLTNDANAAYDLVSEKIKEIDTLKNTRKHLGEFLASKESMLAFYERYSQEKKEGLIQLYGAHRVQPISDHIMIPLLVEGSELVAQENNIYTYSFPTEYILDMTRFRLELGGYANIARDGWTKLRISL